jgi:hypothetical protein
LTRTKSRFGGKDANKAKEIKSRSSEAWRTLAMVEDADDCDDVNGENVCLIRLLTVLATRAKCQFKVGLADSQLAHHPQPLLASFLTSSFLILCRRLLPVLNVIHYKKPDEPERETEKVTLSVPLAKVVVVVGAKVSANAVN